MSVGRKGEPLNESASIWILLALDPSISVHLRLSVVTIDDHFIWNLLFIVRAAAEECLDKLFDFSVSQFYNRVFCSLKTLWTPVMWVRQNRVINLEHALLFNVSQDCLLLVNSVIFGRLACVLIALAGRNYHIRAVWVIYRRPCIAASELNIKLASIFLSAFLDRGVIQPVLVKLASVLFSRRWLQTVFFVCLHQVRQLIVWVFIRILFADYSFIAFATLSNAFFFFSIRMQTFNFGAGWLFKVFLVNRQIWLVNSLRTVLVHW